MLGAPRQRRAARKQGRDAARERGRSSAEAFPFPLPLMLPLRCSHRKASQGYVTNAVGAQWGHQPNPVQSCCGYHQLLTNTCKEQVSQLLPQQVMYGHV
jgi:hypothetical protein